MRQNFASQMTVHFAQTDSRLKANEQALEDRLKHFQSDLLGRVHMVDKRKSERFDSLEKENRELRKKMERFELVVPVLMEELKDLGEAVTAQDEESDELEAEPEEIETGGTETEPVDGRGDT